MLKIENLRKDYPDFSLNCSLEINRGSVTGLIGPNGAGKSTTFKAILGLIAPDSGRISLFGKDIREFGVADKQKIGVVLSDSGFSGYLSIDDIAAVLENLYEKFDKTFFLNQLKKFELPRAKKIKDFSTGMKAKLKVLTAISHDAEFLILDEPTAGLDAIARDELYTLLREFMEKDENRSVLISSHFSADLETLCDDLYMIDAGEIVLHEDADVILSDYAILKTDPEQFAALDRQYVLSVKKERYGYRCLTDQKRFYVENFPGVAIENGTIDEVMRMIAKGEEA